MDWMNDMNDIIRLVCWFFLALIVIQLVIIAMQTDSTSSTTYDTTLQEVSVASPNILNNTITEIAWQRNNSAEIEQDVQILYYAPNWLPYKYDCLQNCIVEAVD